MRLQMESPIDPCSALDGASDLSQVKLQCPACREGMASLPAISVACTSCGFTIEKRDGIYRALTPDAWIRFSQFVSEYQLIREKEGRGSESDDYYLALPFRDVTRRNDWQWSIRARTFTYFEKNILPRISVEHPNGANVLDVGSGNGWLSYRLAQKGHHPIAIDLADNKGDGLGAAQHYCRQLDVEFPCFQAEMDRLPFAAGQFDVIIFNASFHYSLDYETTLKESLRCLRPAGYLVIADSPFYRRKESGQQMVEQRKAEFIRKFGFASDSLAAQEFLTAEVLTQLSRSLGIRWRIDKPWYGVDWALRPVKARIRRKREPSKFYLIWTRAAQ